MQSPIPFVPHKNIKHSLSLSLVIQYALNFYSQYLRNKKATILLQIKKKKNNKNYDQEQTDP